MFLRGGGESSIACGRNVQVAKRLGSESSRGRTVLVAKRLGGEPSRGRNVHDWGRNVKVAKRPVTVYIGFIPVIKWIFSYARGYFPVIKTVKRCQYLFRMELRNQWIHAPSFVRKLCVMYHNQSVVI